MDIPIQPVRVSNVPHAPTACAIWAVPKTDAASVTSPCCQLSVGDGVSCFGTLLGILGSGLGTDRSENCERHHQAGGGSRKNISQRSHFVSFQLQRTISSSG